MRWIVQTAEEFVEIFSQDFVSQNYILYDDIDLANISKDKLNSSATLTGTFDGNGYTIKNFSGEQFTLFDKINRSGEITDLTIKNFTLKENTSGLLCTKLAGNIKNIVVQNIDSTFNQTDYSGVIAKTSLTNSTVSDITIQDSTITNKSNKSSLSFISGTTMCEEARRKPSITDITIHNCSVHSDLASLITGSSTDSLKVTNVCISDVTSTANDPEQSKFSPLASFLSGKNVSITDITIQNLHVYDYSLVTLMNNRLNEHKYQDTTISNIDIQPLKVVNTQSPTDIVFDIADSEKLSNISIELIDDNNNFLEDSHYEITKLLLQYDGSVSIDYREIQKPEKEPLIVLKNGFDAIFKVYLNCIEIKTSDNTCLRPFNTKQFLQNTHILESLEIVNVTERFDQYVTAYNL